jgi:hypothetical protein
MQPVGSYCTDISRCTVDKTLNSRNFQPIVKQEATFRSLSSVEWVQFIAFHPPLLIYILILPHYVTKGAFFSGQLTETLHEFVLIPMQATGPANLTPFGSDHQNNYWWRTDFRWYLVCLLFYPTLCFLFVFYSFTFWNTSLTCT